MPTLPNFNTVAKNLTNLVPVNKLADVSLVNNLQNLGTSASNALGNIGGNLNNLINKLPSIPGLSTEGNNERNNTVNKIVGINETTEKKVPTPNPKPPPWSNELHDYASYNYIWTMSILTPEMVNFPDLTYRQGKLGKVIFKSASGDPDNRIALTNYASPANPSGKFDYFMENIRITGVTGLDKNTGNTNSTGLTFTVVEPYSVGLFFQSLQVGAAESGYKNWIDMPVLLTLEFMGHESIEKQNQKTIARKFFPIKIMGMSMRVTSQGSSYDCTGVPWNERAFSTTMGTIKTDVTISGRTVQEMLQKGPKSLQTVINDAMLANAINNGIPVADQILILFPSDIATDDGKAVSDDKSSPPSYTQDPGKGAVYGDTAVFKKLGVEKASNDYLVQNDNVNKIGSADMGFIDQRKTEAVFGKDNASWDAEKKVFVRGNVIIKEKEGQATFKQGTSIPNIINQLLMSSDYGRQALNNIDNEGYITWWRIDTQLYVLGTEANLNKTGSYPSLGVFRIFPHKVHHSRFVKSKDKPAGVKELKALAVKRYDYIYTSKNIDVIDFQIQFNNSFYTALAADGGQNNKGKQMRDSQAADSTPKSKVKVVNGKISNIRIDSEGKEYDATDEYSKGKHGNAKVGDSASGVVVRYDQTNISANQGGANQDDPGTVAARQFHKAVNSLGDMVSVTMKILGDPFYLGDSGMGNYTAKATNNPAVNSDGAINYQKGEVYILLYFYNPVDINYKTGYYDFPSGKVIPQFCGLYRVGRVESTFDKGYFTQQLDLLRMPNQDIDGEAGKPRVAVTEQLDGFDPGGSIPDPDIDNDR